MKCDICGEEVDNSEALANHMEKMHALEESDNAEQESSKEEEVPEPAPIIPGRM